jgi:glyoxylase-like metal-dependent hydrolase (beta-lactamase superfamily II)
MNALYNELPSGISTIDTGLLRPRFAASYLIQEGEEAAFLDVGPANALPTLLDVLRQKQIAPQQVKYILVTHVHLDHAGAAGHLLHHLPEAQLVVHTKGAKHLIDPQRLIAGATAVYGEELMRRLFGEMLPAPAERVIKAGPNFTLDLHGRPLLFLHTSGHARHHYCVVDERSQGIFAGDTFGLSYREFDTDRGAFIFPTTSPVQFEPEALHASIDQLLSYHPQVMYLSHFGHVTEVARLADDLHHWIDQFVELASGIRVNGQERHDELYTQLAELLLHRLRSHGCQLGRERSLELLHPDLELNAQGLAVWLARREKKQQEYQS